MRKGAGRAPCKDRWYVPAGSEDGRILVGGVPIIDLGIHLSIKKLISSLLKVSVAIAVCVGCSLFFSIFPLNFLAHC